jgi:hypothetical protein
MSRGWPLHHSSGPLRPHARGDGTLDERVEFLRTGSMCRTLLAGTDPATQAKAVASICTALGPYTGTDGGRLDAAVWLVRAVAWPGPAQGEPSAPGTERQLGVRVRGWPAPVRGRRGTAARSQITTRTARLPR